MIHFKLYPHAVLLCMLLGIPTVSLVPELMNQVALGLGNRAMLTLNEYIKGKRSNG
jgi:hypothetical protein